MITIPTEEELTKELEVVKDLAHARYSRWIKDTGLSENEVYGETVFNYLRKYYIFFYLNEKDLEMLRSFIYQVAFERGEFAELLEKTVKNRAFNSQTRDKFKREMQQLSKNIKYAIEKAETIRKKQDLIKKEFDEYFVTIKYTNKQDLKTFLEFLESSENSVMKTFGENFKNVADVTNGTIRKFNELLKEYEDYNRRVEGEKKHGN